MLQIQQGNAAVITEVLPRSFPQLTGAGVPSVGLGRGSASLREAWPAGAAGCGRPRCVRRHGTN